MASPIDEEQLHRHGSSEPMLPEEPNFRMTRDSDFKSTADGNRGTQLELRDSPTDSVGETQDQRTSLPPSGEYKVYKRRFFCLAQLVLLNIIVSWDWLSFSPVSKTSSQYFHVSQGAINWLSTGFLFAFLVATPATIWTLNKRGPKDAIIVSACLIFVGNWVRYAGTRAGHGHFGVVMFGQILIGLAQPFILSAPTRLSDLWFSDKGRTSATAVASLANPFGGALGQLINPFWATQPSDIPNMVLYVSIIASIASIPSFFIPSHPPTPPTAAAHSYHASNPNSSTTTTTTTTTPSLSLRKSLLSLSRSLPFYLIALPYAIYVGFFNALSSLFNQILEPHGYTETEAGICGAILIVVGLVAAAIVSPLVDRYKPYLLTIKICIPLIALCYLIFIWAPGAGSIVAPYVVSAALGAASFAVVPVALEYLVEIMYPMSPEVGSTLCWAGGQLSGAIFIIVMNALKNQNEDGNMKRALIFQAVIALVFAPLPLFLGVWGIEVRTRRAEVERGVGTAV